MKVSIWVDWGIQEVYPNFDAVKEEWKNVCEDESDVAPTNFETWLNNHYNPCEVWHMDENERQAVLKEYNDYCDECFQEWVQEYLDEVEINI